MNKEKNEDIIQGFKAVDFMRKTRNEISEDIVDLNFEELKKYFEKRKKAYFCCAQKENNET